MKRRALVLAAPVGLLALRGSTSRANPVAKADMIAPDQELSVEQAVARSWADAAKARLSPTSDSERRAIASLVPALIADRASGGAGSSGRDTDLAAIARSGNLRIERWRVAGRRFFAIRDTNPRGAGAYYFPARGDRPPRARVSLLLQAPHELFDMNTGHISARWFFAGLGGSDPIGFFTNTIHRYEDRPGVRNPHPNSAADVCHNARHLFSTATAAAARAGVRVVLQIHGFAPSEAEAGTRVVVSAGRESGATPRSRAIAQVLAGVLGGGVKRFPDDTRMLGATTNAQGLLLARIPGVDFVHIELSPSVRDTLMRDAKALAAFAAALTRAAG